MGREACLSKTTPNNTELIKDSGKINIRYIKKIALDCSCAYTVCKCLCIYYYHFKVIQTTASSWRENMLGYIFVRRNYLFREVNMENFLGL